MGLFSSKIQQEEELVKSNELFLDVNGKKLRLVHIKNPVESTPLIIFVPGFGGNVGQWINQLEHFSHVASVLSFEICGFGKSEKPEAMEFYRTSSVVDDLIYIIKKFKLPKQDLVLIGHSYGTAIVSKAYGKLIMMEAEYKPTLVCFLSPKMDATIKELQFNKRILSLPNFVINIFRLLERIGGTNSVSVTRLLSKNASESLREKQLFWNAQVDTNVYSIDCPREEDQVTKLENFNYFKEVLAQKNNLESHLIKNAGHNIMLEFSEIVNAFIYNFLKRKLIHKENGIEFGLHHMLQKDVINNPKWSLKNFEKWKKIESVSKNVYNFRPMKTLLQNDPTHSPSILLKNNENIGLIIDISKDEPKYESKELNTLTSKYKKISTTSKIPPTESEVDAFINECEDFWSKHPTKEIGVHCHYGFNRTGFMICCYLIKKKKLKIKDAIMAFKESRYPGIKHLHFIDELYIRFHDLEV
ncbi:hypothetical protein HK099_005492 [Clydaea vesicula]|uniref:Tyrosine specific protein phosphatases domain-containing protein n=1 Tax=Clydaea vesicula TaxID=447962 RepID=A0AAD5U6G0_9FUNG|nr:hypothetical protein HK099_005492 [Clydaea vesicula]